MSVSDTRYVAPAARVTARAIDGQVIVVELESDRVYELDEVGSHIWSLLEDGIEVSALRARLLADYDAHEERLVQELDVFLQELSAQGIVTVDDRPA